MLLCKNYAMPVKTMIYDAMNYGDQVNEAKKHHQKNKDYKSSDEEKLNDLITKDETFTRVDVETVAAINLFVGTDIKYDEKEEVVNMCKAWDDHKKRGIQEGMQRGMQQGMQQGRLFEIYLSVQEGDYSAKRGAEKAEMSLDEFEKAMSKAGYKIPELV